MIREFNAKDALADILSNVGVDPSMMERIEIIPNLVDPLLIFDNLNDCSIWIKENVKDVHPPEEN